MTLSNSISANSLIFFAISTLKSIHIPPIIVIIHQIDFYIL
jgi:hypothetical protein